MQLVPGLRNKQEAYRKNDAIDTTTSSTLSIFSHEHRKTASGLLILFTPLTRVCVDGWLNLCMKSSFFSVLVLLLWQNKRLDA